MNSETMVITPELAREFLTKNKKNRIIRTNRIKQYATDMKNGKWELNDQGISFHEDGSLANGQHRLLAIIESNTPTEMYVTYGVPNDSNIYDRGAARSTSDTLTIGGYDSDVANTNVVSGINFLFTYFKGRTPTDAMVAAFCDDYHDIVVEASSVTNSGGGSPKITRKAPIVAAAACALICGIPADGLRSFFSVVNTGFSEGKNQAAAIVLRNYLLMGYGKGTLEEKKYLFAFTPQAICDFAKGKSRVKKYPFDTKPAFYKFVKANIFDRYDVS